MDVRGCPIDGNGGNWEGERGNSTWVPDRNDIPKNPLTNPDKLTWGELLDKYGIDGIPFKDGEADFSEVSKGEVEIDDFTDDRAANFDQADEKLAEQRGCTPEEVAKWREEHKYTWHECKDCKTMQKVPTEIHGNVPHSGGVSEYRMRKAEE
ncbi:MAG: HNH endonuclease [Lachnospiraceae bacterium]|nr:HNH endonuclease [Lachnospiraceae bacterium]